VLLEIARIYAQTAGDLGFPDKSVDTNVVGAGLQLVWAICGILAVVFVAIGGIKYTLSNGDPGQVSSAKNTILYALVGLIVSVSAFTITTFVLGRI
jgi:hypothetical protein